MPYVLARKLKAVKEELKKWNREVFGDVKLRKYNLLDSINVLDAKEESVGLSIEDIEQRRRDREGLGRVLQLEEIVKAIIKGVVTKGRGPQHKVFP